MPYLLLFSDDCGELCILDPWVDGALRGKKTESLGRGTDGQTDRQADRQAGTQIDRRPDRERGGHTDRDRRTDRQSGRQTGGRTDGHGRTAHSRLPKKVNRCIDRNVSHCSAR